MGCSSPDPPDYNALAQQQGVENVEAAKTQAALDRYDAYNRYGSTTWSQDPNNPLHYTRSENLSPAEAHRADLRDFANTAALKALADYAPFRLQEAFGQTFMPGENEVARGFDPRYGPTERLQTDSGMWGAAPMQEDVNLAAAPGIPTADAETRRQMTEAVYRQGASMLDPQFAQQQGAMNSDLSNQGIFLGSDAYGTAQDNFARQKMAAYGDLRDRAIQAGGEEMARDFGLGMQAHQAGVSDIMQSGEFHNTARNQMISQLEADMSNRNAALTGQANIGAQAASLQNQGAALNQQMELSGAAAPINMMNSIRSGTQAAVPQTQVPTVQNIAAPNLMQAATDQYNADSGQAQARNAQIGNYAMTAATIAAMS